MAVELLGTSWIHQSAYTFYLTGSRFFGTNNAESDYDYFVEDSADLRRILDKWGLKQVTSSYVDCATTAVYVDDSGRYHIQLISPKFLQRKIAIQKIILDYGLAVANKQYMQHLWQALLDIA